MVLALLMFTPWLISMFLCAEWARYQRNVRKCRCGFPFFLLLAFSASAQTGVRFQSTATTIGFVQGTPVVQPVQASLSTANVTNDAPAAPNDPLEAMSVNGQVNVTLYAVGSDLGAQVAAAAATFGPSTCPNLLIPAGTYNWTTLDIVLRPCTHLEASGAVVKVPADITAPPLVFARRTGGADTLPGGAHYFASMSIGNVHGLTIIGSDASENGSKSSIPAIFVGGDIGGTWTNGNTNYVGDLITFQDVNVFNFGAGYEMGRAFQVTWLNGSITANGYGLSWQDGPAADENENLHGTQILNNYHAGIHHVEHGHFVELGLFGVSIDYNGQHTGEPNIQWTNGQIAMTGGHIEARQFPMVQIVAPNSGVNASIGMTGVGFANTNTSASTAAGSFFEIDGLDDAITLGPGNTFGSAGAPVKSIANWAILSQSQYDRFHAAPYTDGRFKALSGVEPHEYSFPVFNQYGLMVYMQSSYTPVPVQTQPYSLVMQGNYLGWNRSVGLGHSDFLNNPGAGPGGWDFWKCNSTGTSCGVVVSIGGAGTIVSNGLKMNGLKGNGNDYACIAADGTLFRSITACR